MGVSAPDCNQFLAFGWFAALMQEAALGAAVEAFEKT
jgi:hypothetical protein